MDLYIVDAFTDRIFEGNQAGVVVIEDGGGFPSEKIMQKIAAELKHSETAFVKSVSEDTFELKYYTPLGEVPLCGHATISAFTVLRDEKKINVGTYMAKTLAGDLKIVAESDCIWMEMAQGKIVEKLQEEVSFQLYQAYGLDIKDKPADLAPCIVNSGLSDILLPVEHKSRLDLAIQKREIVIEMSRRLGVVGVHMFCRDNTSEVTAFCRNFAPLYGIEEESATGTSNASLTHYFNTCGLIDENRENIFIQGEAMGKPTMIKSRITSGGIIYIGGNAKISVRGSIIL